MMQKHLVTFAKYLGVAITGTTTICVVNNTLPCYKCGRMQTLFALREYGGICGPCHRKSRKSIKNH